MKLLLLFSLASSVMLSGRAFAAATDDESKREAQHEAFKSCIDSTGVTSSGARAAAQQ